MIDGERADLMLDSGASVNLIDEITYKEIYKGKEKNKQDAKFTCLDCQALYHCSERSKPK